jgi:hypothetical protein
MIFCSGKIHLEIVEFLQEINCFQQNQLQVKTIRQAFQRPVAEVTGTGGVSRHLHLMNRCHRTHPSIKKQTVRQ